MAHNSRLLFVDDEDSIRFALRDYFTAAGYVVSTARDGREADTLLARDRFDVVIIDLQLEPNDAAPGLELLRRVRVQYPMTPAVLFTAHGTRAIARETGRLGATFLEKPLPLTTLRSIIDGLRAARPVLETDDMPRPCARNRSVTA